LEATGGTVVEGGTSGHADMTVGYDCDSACTAGDVEVYELV